MRIAAILVGIAVATAPASAAPRGKFVRIPVTRTVAIPSLCIALTDAQLLCLGPTAVDERIALFSNESGAYVGELRVDKSAPSQLNACRGQTPYYQVDVSIVRGKAASMFEHSPVGFRNAPLVDEHSELVRSAPAPSGSTEHDATGLDYDGDGQLDFALEQFTCQRPGTRDTGLCVESYARSGTATKLHRVRQDRVPRC